jgi:NADPH:quinone reductase-like Zn-dependent oxidoreductase
MMRPVSFEPARPLDTDGMPWIPTGPGGVGAYVVQLAAAHGARVTATASARDRGFVTGLGAGEVIDYAGRFEDQVADVDVVVDPVGGQILARSWPVLRSGGILIAIADELGAGHGGRRDVRGVYFVVRPDGGQLRELAVLAGRQQLRPVVSVTFGLADLAAAFRAQQHGPRPLGKVAVRVDRTAAPGSRVANTMRVRDHASGRGCRP